MSAVPRTESQLAVLEGVGKVFDYWREPRGLNIAVGIRVPGNRVDEVLEKLKSAGMEPRIEVEDVGQLVKKQEDSNAQVSAKRQDAEGKGNI